LPLTIVNVVFRSPFHTAWSILNTSSLTLRHPPFSTICPCARQNTTILMVAKFPPFFAPSLCLRGSPFYLRPFFLNSWPSPFFDLMVGLFQGGRWIMSLPFRVLTFSHLTPRFFFQGFNSPSFSCQVSALRSHGSVPCRSPCAFAPTFPPTVRPMEGRLLLLSLLVVLLV